MLYRSSITAHAEAQLAHYHSMLRYAGACRDIWAMVETYRLYGPVDFHFRLDTWPSVDEGRFSCGHAYTIRVGRLLATFILTAQDHELILVDVSIT